MPEIGTRFERVDAQLADLRIWPVPGFRRHLIFYTPTDDGIRIVRVLHAARDWQEIIGEQ
jgi:toxin ParE1/3/4